MNYASNTILQTLHYHIGGISFKVYNIFTKHFLHKPVPLQLVLTSSLYNIIYYDNKTLIGFLKSVILNTNKTYPRILITFFFKYMITH